VAAFRRGSNVNQNDNSNALGSEHHCCSSNEHPISDTVLAKKAKHRNGCSCGTPIHVLHPYFGLFLNLSVGIQLAIEDAQTHEGL
jgi:hypothetical protein